MLFTISSTNSHWLTQTELAEIVGVSKGAIGNYESNISSPKDEILFKIMATLNVDANFIFQDSIKKPVIITDDELVKEFLELPDETKKKALEFAKFVLLREKSNNL